ncbi:hypothetical protein EBZ39_17595, partial [bacterium]|nr:hypothetical protein [bacterium]
MALRGKTEEAKTQAAIEAALLGLPAAGPLARLAGRGAKAVGKEAARAIDETMMSGEGTLATALAPAAPFKAVKNKGGNWLADYPSEDPLKPLKISPTISGQIINDAAGRDIFSDYLKDVHDVGLHEWTRENYPEIYRAIQSPEDFAINNWIDQKLRKYVRNEMGTPEDPLRVLLEERGISHVSPDVLSRTADDIKQKVRVGSDFSGDLVSIKRANAGFPKEGISTTKFKEIPMEGLTTDQFNDISDRYHLASGWEQLTDEAILNKTAYDILSEQGYPGADRWVMLNPWLKKVPPETVVHNMYGPRIDPAFRDMNFQHLVDELYGAMSPDSALPPGLRISPDDLAKMNMPQAVERVAKIRDWTTEEAARAERAAMLENLKASPRSKDESLNLSFVDKPGGTWVDIPETTDEAGRKMCTAIGKSAGWCTQHSNLARQYGSGDNRLAALIDSEGRPHV